MNAFDQRIKRDMAAIDELKAARMRSSAVLATGSKIVKATINFTNYAPDKYAKVIITPTSASARNMLTAVTQPRWDSQNYWRAVRIMEGESICYYLQPQGEHPSGSITYTIEATYTSPATVTLKMVDPPKPEFA